jgi:starch synthase (maltosyl-transferring)
MAQAKKKTTKATATGTATKAGGNSGAAAVVDRLLIERVTPELDGGRYPVKRVVGDRVDVEADVIKDGHDLFGARICYRGPNDSGWRYAALRYEFGADRWYGSFVVDAVGRWTFSVEAWEDPFATWRDELRKKFDAAQVVELELAEGALLLEAAARRARDDARARLQEAAGFLRNNEALTNERVRRGTDVDLAELMAGHVDHAHDTRYPRDLELVVDRREAQFASWYELFPRSQSPAPGVHATFADATRRLPRLAELGFDVVYLPPIHPIGHTFRKGPNNSLQCGPDDPGSPWAIGNEDGGHTAIEPKLGTLADFEHFVRAAREHRIEIALDFALQCSPDHPWVKEHPDWFHVRPDGSIRHAENPPKKYQDIVPIHFWCADRENLWNACRDAMLFWVERGVRIFRVDNPHTKPLAFWQWAIREIQDRHPDVIFLAEAFTRPKRLAALAKLGFTQSYGYFTWRTSAADLRSFVEELAHGELAEFHRPNFFANTPDILHEYLQTGGRPAFRVRLVLAATLSPTWGIYSGYELCENVPVRPGSEEYLDSEKYQLRFRDWEAPGNLNADIATINRIRRENPALQQLRNIAFHSSENDAVLFFHKWADGGANDILVAVNLDPFHAQETMLHVPVGALGFGSDSEYQVEDLLTGARYTWRGARNYVRLDPGEQVAHVMRVVR